MRQLTILVAVIGLLGVAATWSVTGAPSAAVPANATKAGLAIRVEQKNPFTHLEVNNRPNSFQFAIVSDRTGGRRPGVFSKAVDKINLLQPEFVVSVGDLIEGYSEDPGTWALEWSEFESKLTRFQMPFFFCPGNHDIANLPMSKEWYRKFGRTYYEFRYQDCLFVVLNTEDEPQKDREYFFTPDQRAWLKQTLAANQDVRWTFVFLHKPVWSITKHKLPEHTSASLGWDDIEASLQGRQYTVFSGHNHVYAKSVRKGMDYYILATTGGASKMEGLKAGQFDHFAWVTMKDNAPIVANILLDGVEDKNIRVVPDGGK
ncbi:MAG: metallophosphoesterase family protein [Planctomycetaceae bacterium]